MTQKGGNDADALLAAAGAWLEVAADSGIDSKDEMGLPTVNADHCHALSRQIRDYLNQPASGGGEAAQPALPVWWVPQACAALKAVRNYTEHRESALRKSGAIGEADVHGGMLEAIDVLLREAEAQHSSSAAQEYARKNPLGGPATMFRAIAKRIELGEDYHAVLRDYSVTVGSSAAPNTTSMTKIELAYCEWTGGHLSTDDFHKEIAEAVSDEWVVSSSAEERITAGMVIRWAGETLQATRRTDSELALAEAIAKVANGGYLSHADEKP